jgi:OPA family glycerol-3-phosphate transporter-like MFS transporter
MAGSIVFTLLFTASAGFPMFTLMWMGNRSVQSLGWAGVVNVTSKWFSYTTYGTVMGIVSLSYLFGDALAREFMAALLGAGLGWRGVFWAAAGTLAVLLVVNFVLLKASPRSIGLPEPASDPDAVFRAPEGSMLTAFARSPLFWTACVVSLGVTMLRETFNLWTPTYFTQAVGMTVAEAAHKSALFPLFGGFSVLLAGFLGDRLGRSGRATIILSGLLLTTVLLLAVAFDWFGRSTLAPVVLVGLTAFTLIGPYSYLAGAIALDFGGKRGSATASGIIDGVGYLGGVLAGTSVASISVRWNWTGAFGALAAVALLTSVAALVFLALQRGRVAVVARR